MIFCLCQDKRILPAAYACLTNKNTVSYEKLLLTIKSAMTEPILLESFRIDFEKGMKKAVKNVFPGVQVSGCFFHFKKAIWTNVQNLGLTSHFNQDVNFQLWLNMIYGLAYLPVSEVFIIFPSAFFT